MLNEKRSLTSSLLATVDIKAIVPPVMAACQAKCLDENLNVLNILMWNVTDLNENLNVLILM